MRLLLSFAIAVSSVAIAAEDPLELMRKSDKAHRVPYERAKARMVLQEKDGPPRERIVETWNAADDKNGDKSRVRFHSPADVQGTGLLSIENVSGGEDEQWLYLPAFKKTRRVGQAELGDRFVGTDFYYEDMKRRSVEDSAYKLLPDEKIDDQDCWVIEATPSAPKLVKESPYGKVQLWLRKDNLFVIKARFFDKKLAPLKELKTSRLKQVTKVAWRADETQVIDVKRKHRTMVSTTERDVRETAEDVFTRRQLEAE